MPIPSSRFLCLLPGILASLLACSAAIAQIREEKPGPGLDEGILAHFDRDGKHNVRPAAGQMIGTGDFSIVCHLVPPRNFPVCSSRFPIAEGLDGVPSQVLTGPRWLLLVGPDGALTFTARTKPGADAITTPKAVVQASIAHEIIISVHRDARQPLSGIWVDGVEVASGIVPPIDLKATLPTDTFGNTKSLTVYNRALTRPEILELTLRGSGVASDKPKPKHPAPPPNGPRFIPQQDETIALIGGTEAVALAESGELEALLLMAFPQTKFHFRCLAWEGDTVFRQDRPMNFGSLEQQLRRVNAGAVFVMFGRQECLDAASKNKERGYGAAYSPNSPATPNDGKTAAAPPPAPRSLPEADLAEFKAAYEKLLDTVEKVTPNIVVIGPLWFEQKEVGMPDLSRQNRHLVNYNTAIRDVGSRREALFVDILRQLRNGGAFAETPAETRFTSDGVTLSNLGASTLSGMALRPLHLSVAIEQQKPASILLSAIAAKNRLWHDYWRPSNWAFLHGDRTNQPSSRDPVNPQIRLFPAEQEKYLPLIRDAEEKIYKLVQDADKKVP